MSKSLVLSLFLIICSAMWVADDAYAGNKLTTVLRKFPALQALTAATVITVCSISGCLPRSVDSWLRGTSTVQAQAQRTSLAVSEIDVADSARHVFGYYHNGYFLGEITTTGENYYTIKQYKHGRSEQIPKDAVEAVLIADHPDIGLLHNLATDIVGAMYLRGKVIGVYRYLEHADTFLYVYYVHESIDFGGQLQPHDDSIVYRSVRRQGDQSD